MKKSILMAIIGSPHGIKGELHIKSFSDDPFALRDYPPLYDTQGRQFKIVKLRAHKTRLIGQIEGVTSREAAQNLQGVELFIDRDNFYEDLDDDEFYQTDLLGFRVYDIKCKRELGTVSGFFNFGAGDLVEIREQAGKSWLIPFTHAAVPVIDEEKGEVGIDSQAAGLVDEDREETLS